MNDLIKSPYFVFGLSFLLMWLSARIGAFFRKRQPKLENDARQDLDLIVTNTLTLLSLIIAFSFSMAISRYDQRKTYEAAEANAIGTEYVRADLLPVADAARVRVLLRNYLDQRVLFYGTRSENTLRQIDASTVQLQTDLWSAVQAPAAKGPTPMLALVVSGMNDVLDSEGYTQASWWNQIPGSAWGLIAAIAICSNLLVGYGMRRAEPGAIHFLVLPLVLSAAFFLIRDIDSPRRGIIRVSPENLTRLVESLHPD
jgi:hypothetical protein